MMDVWNAMSCWCCPLPAPCDNEILKDLDRVDELKHIPNRQLAWPVLGACLCNKLDSRVANLNETMNRVSVRSLCALYLVNVMRSVCVLCCPALAKGLPNVPICMWATLASF